MPQAITDTRLVYEGNVVGFTRVARQGFHAGREAGQYIEVVWKAGDTSESYERRLLDRLEREERRRDQSKRKYLSPDDRAFLRDMRSSRINKKLDSISARFDGATFDNDLDAAFAALKDLQGYFAKRDNRQPAMDHKAIRILAAMIATPRYDMVSNQHAANMAKDDPFYTAMGRWKHHTYDNFGGVALRLMIDALPNDMHKLHTVHNALVARAERGLEPISEINMVEPDAFFNRRYMMHYDWPSYRLIRPLEWADMDKAMPWLVAVNSPLLEPALSDVVGRVQTIFNGHRDGIHISQFNVHAADSAARTFPGKVRAMVAELAASDHPRASSAAKALAGIDAVMGTQFDECDAAMTRLREKQEALRAIWGCQPDTLK